MELNCADKKECEEHGVSIPDDCAAYGCAVYLQSRITQLEATVRELTSELTDAVMSGHKLEADKRVLVEALEFYANESHWYYPARKALAQVKGGLSETRQD